MDKETALVKLSQERSYNRQHIAMEIIAYDSYEMTAEDIREIAREIFDMEED